MSTVVAPIEDRRLYGIGLVLFGYALFTVIDSSAKWLSLSGMPTMQVVLIRYAGQFLLVSALFLPSRGASLLKTRSLRLEVLRGLALLGSTIFNFFALLYLPLTITASIAFTAPLLLCAVSGPLLGEHVGWRRWLAILVGFLGVLVIIRPGTDSFHPAVLLSLAGTVCGVFYLVLTKRLAGVDTVMTQQFYAGLTATLCIAPFGFAGWTWPTGASGWTAFALIGLAAFIGHMMLTSAHRFAPASVLAPFSYVQIIFMTASSWFIFHQPPEIWVLIGAPIVIGSGLYIWLRERQLAKRTVTEAMAAD